MKSQNESCSLKITQETTIIEVEDEEKDDKNQKDEEDVLCLSNKEVGQLSATDTCLPSVGTSDRIRCESLSTSESTCTVLESVDQKQQVVTLDLEKKSVESHELVEIDLNQGRRRRRRRRRRRSESSVELSIDEENIIEQTDKNNCTNKKRKKKELKKSVSQEETNKMYGQQISGQYRLPTLEVLDDPHTNQQTQSQQQQQHHYLHQQQFRGFQDVPPKISFTSQRVKEYFESFRGHGNYESKRVYQFFKSTRTELVACLLFSLISSQALILCRSRLFSQESSDHHNWPLTAKLTADKINSSSNNNISTSTSTQLLARRSENPLAVHITEGLVLAFTVASLTQVFGHISGCHLIPSVSLALYIKGHISRGRLASYVGAQALGSGLGVSLLSLLRSSQITGAEYRLALEAATRLSRSRRALSRKRRSSRLASPILTGAELRPSSGVDASVAATAAAVEVATDASGGSEIDLKELQGSETILLSIMEQQQEEKQHKRGGSSSSVSSSLVEPDEKTITVNGSTYDLKEPAQPPPSSIEPQNFLSSSPSPSPAYSTYSTFSSPSPSPSPSPSHFPTSSSPHLPFASPASLEVPPPSKNLSFPSPAIDPNWPITHKPPIVLSLLQQSEAPIWTTATPATLNFLYSSTTESSTSDEPRPSTVRPRRMKRTKLAQQPQPLAQQLPDSDSNYHAYLRSLHSSSQTEEPSMRYYVNLLELALPDEIMNANSVRECLESEFQRVNSVYSGNIMKRQELESESSTSSSKMASFELELEKRGFVHCLSVSNSSQMFVFQFLATILVVLTYLVNVDPRRVDLGFKSLSIGLSYFVACLLTVQSGGFYGNPFQLLFLNWLAPTSEWQSEWFIYLVTPLIGGLFGAMSHEYIDFSSPRNQNKRLHLRRSFYSLDELPPASSGAHSLRPTHLPVVSCHAHSSDSSGSSETGALSPAESERAVESRAATAAVVEQSAQAQAQAQQQQQQQPQQLISASQLLREHNELPSGGTCRAGRIASGRYRRQLKLEQQQQQLLHHHPPSHHQHHHHHQQQQMLGEPKAAARVASDRANSLRRSDFDSNFLISSPAPVTSPTANPRQRQHQLSHQHQQPQVAAASSSSALTATTLASNWM